MKGDPSRKPTPSDDDGDRFLAAVPHGRANALTGREIAAALGLTDNDGALLPHWDRHIRALREAAINAGALICADDNGYFIPSCREETDHSLGRRRKQIYTTLASLRAEEALINRSFPAGEGEIEQPLLFAEFMDNTYSR